MPSEGSPPKDPGRREGATRKRHLSRDRIVATALSMLEREPRRPIVLSAVAKELGVGTMSLYVHIRGKADLAAAVKSAALRRYRCTLDPGLPWDRQLGQVLHALRDHAKAHPFLAFEPARSGEAWPELLSVLVPVLRRAGLRERDLAEAARWVARTFRALVLLDGWTPVGEGCRFLYRDFDELSDEGKVELEAVLPRMAQGTPDHAFAFAVERAAAAVRDLARSGGENACSS